MFRRSNVFRLCLVFVALSAGQVRSEQSEAKPESESVWVTSIARLGTSDEFVAATADGLLLREAAVYSFKADNPNERTQLYTHPAAVWCVAASSGGGRIASVDYRGNLVMFEKSGPGPQTHEKAFERWCQAMLISPDDRFVIAGNEAGKVMVWEMSANRVTNSVELDGHAVTGLAISPDGKLLAASDGGGHVHLLKWPELEAVGKIDISAEPAWCVAFVDQGSHLMVGSGDRQLYRCEAKADAKPEIVAKGTDWITELAVSPTGQVAAAEVGGKLHFPSGGGTDSMDAKSGVWALCWNGDSQLLAGTRKDGIVIAGRSWKWTEPKPAAAEPVKQEAESGDQPNEPKPAETAPEEAKESPEKPQEQAEAKPADEKPAEEKPAEEKPAEEKPADNPSPDADAPAAAAEKQE